jgi:AraC family transcriptional regulator
MATASPETAVPGLGKIAILSAMTASVHRLAFGPGWRVDDVICTAGPRQRPFEERHDTICIAAVVQGSFQYRSSHGAATLAPGSLLLGNQGDCFECGHDHAVGDRCLSFHYAPEAMEEVAAALPGAPRVGFAAPRLPPIASLAPLIAAAECAREDRDEAALEEIGLRLAGAVTTLVADGARSPRSPSWRDERRVTAALRRIEAEPDAPLSLAACASAAAMSRFHFLRTFQAVVGMTPHQYLLATRLRRAALRLRRSDDNVAAIAYEAGFGDLSTFNRRFRRLTGQTPTDYRAG